MSNQLALFRGPIQPSHIPSKLQQQLGLWRGAVEPRHGKGAIISEAKRGGYACETHIAGFAGFNIQRPKERPAPAKKP